jgi:hypothetical protein
MDAKIRVAVLSGLTALVAGFLAAMLLEAPGPDPDGGRSRLLEVVGPEDGIIIVDRFPPGWPRTLPLPSDTEPKWAVASEGRLWACFTYRPSHVGFGGTRLLRFFREHLPIAGYQTGPTTQVQEGAGLFVGNLGFVREDGRNHWGRISVPLTVGALRLGGIACRFSVEVQYFSD